MPQCKVWLDNYQGAYIPGSNIQGKIVLDFESETTFRAIKIKVQCHEHTEFMATETYYDDREKEHRSRDTLFRGDNNVFTSEIIIYGGQSGTTSLPMGQHIYPFNFPLPPNIPATYNSENGSIQYKLFAILDKPMAFDNEDQFIFMVNAPVDLNMLRRPELLEPSSYSDDKTVCCLCCAQGPITMDVNLPKKTLIPNETVTVSVRMTNMSNTNVEEVTLELKQKITLKATEPQSSEKDHIITLCDLKDVGLGAHGENTYSFNVTLANNFVIPNFAQCRLFKVEYYYKVLAKLPGVHKNLEIRMYPELGHIPIGGSLYPNIAAANPSAPPSEFNNSKFQEAAPNFYGDNNLGNQLEQPPPSYDTLNL